MKRYKCVRATGVPVTALMLAITLSAVSADAQSADGADALRSSSRPVEVTPFVALGSTASSRVGVAIAFELTPTVSLEAEVGYRQGEVHALSSNVSLSYDLPTLGRVTPYLVGGAGLEEYGTALQVPGAGIVTQPRIALTVNAGGGLKMPLDETWAFRTDARWFNGIGNHAPEHWRLYNGITLGKRRR